MAAERITIARGDGIGPEIMDATLRILEASGADIETDEIEVGKKAFESGIPSGIPEEAWQKLYRNRVFLKAPITTPQGGGYKSLNVTIRKTLGLFANVRPCQAFAPFVPSKHPNMDVTIVRENEEDLYTGIEHQQTNEVLQSLKLLSKTGSERIIRYAFEYAKAHKRKKVTCMTKDNIMKHTDGTFHRIFKEVAEEYPDIRSEHRIIDIGAAELADEPEIFEVIVSLNLYGDILSDISSQLSGSVGLGGSSNVGKDHAMFEAIHGSAPDIAGKDAANPSGLLNGAIMMLMNIGQPNAATKVRNAWLKTLEDGIHTADLYNTENSQRLVGTEAFADAVIERLGSSPRLFSAEQLEQEDIRIPEIKKTPSKKELIGVDVFVDSGEKAVKPSEMGNRVED
ncbi:MAG: NADP-dependent isocitrate dehydrogenase, partial [Flavobacteriales bacterium]